MRKQLLLEACCFLLVARAALWAVSFARLMTSLQRRSGTARRTAPGDIDGIRWAVERAARHLPVPLKCLPQALAAAWMLRRRGHVPVLLYGVATGFAAHAWVELDGVPVVGGPASAGFKVLARFPSVADPRTGPQPTD